MYSRVQDRKSRIAVCLVERNALAASYLRSVLERDPSFEATFEVHRLRNPGVGNLLSSIFVIDVGSLPSSLEAYVTQLRSHLPDAKILLLNEEFPRDMLRRLLFLGIHGLLSYNEVRDRLRPALRAISEGDTWFPPEVASEFQQYSRTLTTGGRLGSVVSHIFTPRERLVLELVERRLGNKEIAAALSISGSTVKFHLSHIFRKLAVRNRHSAVELVDSLKPNHSNPNGHKGTVTATRTGNEMPRLSASK